MNVNRFNRIDGFYVETVIGSMYGYSISDFEWLEKKKYN